MKNSQKIGYVRVSIQEQNLSHQLDVFKVAGCVHVFTDDRISGTAKARDGLESVLAAVGQGDTLVVWKLDRVGRALGYLIKLIADLGNRGVQLVALQDGITP